MQIPLTDATKCNPELALKLQAGIWMAEDLTPHDADASAPLVGSTS